MMFNDWDFCGRPYSKPIDDLKYWLKHVERLVVIEIGAGKDIPTVRDFGSRLTYEGQYRRHKLIRINPRDYAIANDHQVGIAGNALATLEALDALLTC
jgi:hypothetical protein